MSTQVVVTHQTYDCSGAIDYTSLCGQSCPDCDSCCGETCGGCSGIPHTLTGTITSTNSHCACALGLTVVLTFNSGTSKWEGTLSTSGSCSTPGHFIVRTYCSAGTMVADVDLVGDADDCLDTPTTGQSPASFTCSPYNATYNFGIASCCDGAAAESITLTITA